MNNIYVKERKEENKKWELWKPRENKEWQGKEKSLRLYSKKNMREIKRKARMI